MYNFIKGLTENTEQKTLVQITLPYSKTDLDPVMSKETIDYHYGSLYKAYVDRYNNGEGDPNFNEAGAFLHDIYFKQFQEPKSNNQLTEKSKVFIEDNFKSFEEFKKEFEKVAMSIQGSGWVYLSNDGSIKTIKNHEIKQDIVLLIDWWEHSWALDYQADKKEYLNNQWKIIDWNFIESKIK